MRPKARTAARRRGSSGEANHAPHGPVAAGLAGPRERRPAPRRRPRARPAAIVASSCSLQQRAAPARRIATTLSCTRSGSASASSPSTARRRVPRQRARRIAVERRSPVPPAPRSAPAASASATPGEQLGPERPGRGAPGALERRHAHQRVAIAGWRGAVPPPPRPCPERASDHAAAKRTPGSRFVTDVVARLIHSVPGKRQSSCRIAACTAGVSLPRPAAAAARGRTPGTRAIPAPQAAAARTSGAGSCSRRRSSPPRASRSCAPAGRVATRRAGGRGRRGAHAGVPVAGQPRDQRRRARVREQAEDGGGFGADRGLGVRRPGRERLADRSGAHPPARAAAPGRPTAPRHPPPLARAPAGDRPPPAGPPRAPAPPNRRAATRRVGRATARAAVIAGAPGRARRGRLVEADVTDRACLGVHLLPLEQRSEVAPAVEAVVFVSPSRPGSRPSRLLRPRNLPHSRRFPSRPPLMAAGHRAQKRRGQWSVERRSVRGEWL